MPIIGHAGSVHAMLSGQHIRVLSFARFDDTLGVVEKTSALTMSRGRRASQKRGFREAPA
jgi:hypothetical protein